MAALTAALLATTAIASAISQRKEGDYQAGMLDTNASLADSQAQDAIARGAQQESQLRSQAKGVIGAQRTGFAGQGVALDSGSALDVQGDTASLSELDALMIRHNAAREAWGIRTGAAIDRAQAQQVRSASRSRATGTLLTAGLQIAGMRAPSAGASGSTLVNGGNLGRSLAGNGAIRGAY